MSKKRFQDEKEALLRVKACKTPIQIDGKLITLTKSSLVGIGTWGAIDYLCGNAGYIWRKAEQK